MALYQSRVRLIQRRGFSEQNAEDLAERLHLRDVQADDRVLCVEYSHHQLGRCGGGWCARIEPKGSASVTNWHYARCHIPDSTHLVRSEARPAPRVRAFW